MIDPFIGDLIFFGLGVFATPGLLIVIKIHNWYRSTAAKRGCRNRSLKTSYG